MTVFTTTPLGRFQAQSSPRQGTGSNLTQFKQAMTSSISAMGKPDTLSIRFGNVNAPESAAPNEDPATIARLDSLIPRLGEATDWQMDQHQEIYGEFCVGYDLKFKLGETRYTYRHVFDEDDAQQNPRKEVFVLIEEPATGKTDNAKTENIVKKEYPINDQKIFTQYWSKLVKVGYPIMAERAIKPVLNQIDKMTQPRYTQHSHGAILYFSFEGNAYRVAWDREKDTYTLFENSPLPSEQQLESYWKARIAYYEKDNAAHPDVDQAHIPTFDEFKENYMNYGRQTNQYTLTPEQFQQVYGVLKAAIGNKLSKSIGIREDLNPRPLIRTILIRLLHSMSTSGVNYSKKMKQGQITYCPTQGQPGHDWSTALYFEIYRAEKDNAYRIHSKGSKEGQISLVVNNEQDAAVLDKVMAFGKTQHDLREIASTERFYEKFPNFKRKDHTQEQADLAARQAELRAELTEMLPTYRD